MIGEGIVSPRIVLANPLEHHSVIVNLQRLSLCNVIITSILAGKCRERYLRLCLKSLLICDANRGNEVGGTIVGQSQRV